VLAVVALLVLREDPRPSLEQQTTELHHQVFKALEVRKAQAVLEVLQASMEQARRVQEDRADLL
jgi:hypothetical protein